MSGTALLKTAALHLIPSGEPSYWDDCVIDGPELTVSSATGFSGTCGPSTASK